MPDNNQGYTGKVIKKLLPESMNGKAYTKGPINIQWIVIHNMGYNNKDGSYTGGTNSGSYSWFSQGAGGHNTSAHYLVDDKEIWQILEDKWKGHHAGSPKKGHYAGDRGCSNSNSIGIEMADADKVDKPKALELTIELARFLCKKYNVPVDNVVQHNDVTGKDCPAWIRNNNKWGYIKQEIKRRNDENVPISFDSSTLSVGDQTTSDNITSGVGGIDFDNREDWTNLEEIKGVLLIHHPPQHFYSVKNKENAWIKLGYNKEFHVHIDSASTTLGKDKSLIANSIQNNDRHTYISRALYQNKPTKYTLAVGLFTSDLLEDYTVTEKKLIDELGKVLWENALETKDLWREFDMNRAPSPFMYLDREQWKKFLREVDKQVEWRYANFGVPEKKEEKPEENLDDSKNVGKKGLTNKRCGLREQPNMTSNFESLSSGIEVEIKDYKFGFYKVLLKDNRQGWIVANSINVLEDEETEETLRIKIRKLTRETNNGIPQPEITPTMTHEEYLGWKALTDPKHIDNFAGQCEPYDKGLKEITEAPITDDERLASLTKELKTFNENTVYYNVVEGAPGDSGHCVKPTAELNALFKPDPFKVDPIYPDLVVPPNYATSELNKKHDNAIPLTALDEGLIKTLEDFDNKNLTFDFDLLKEMNKKSKGKPVNYLDPYPYDDKIFELEKHSPKVKIDEIESRLYESNHPGDPMPQPVAKNFALVYDAMLNQSKKIESRLVKLENTLAFVLRNLGRVGSRVNINCVYYGGQDTFGKYKTIRCLRDDRVHDACSVTLDQCLSCTRYEPIIGQVYEILDDTGMNGSVMLDQMQMSYMNYDDYRALNRVEERNTLHKFANVNKQENETPKKITEEWEEQDKNKYLESLKNTVTDEEELKKKLESVKKEDYAFIMNWEEKDLDTQEPDVKAYPTEGIKAKYKKTNLGDAGESEENKDNEESEENKVPYDESLIDEEIDKDYLEDLDRLDKLNNGEWVDTREDADTIEVNKYSSEHYFFEDFNKVDALTGGGGTPGQIFGAAVRQKIVEMALKIVEDHKQGLACYHQGTPVGTRTIDYTKPIKGGNAHTSAEAVRYDCSSMASCCYKHAGLTSVYGKTTNTAIDALIKDGGTQFWLCNEEGLKKALPGDLIYVRKGYAKVTEDMLGKDITVQHVMIYTGDRKIAHASTDEKPVPEQIRHEGMDFYLTGKAAGSCFFVRPKDLIEAETITGSSMTGDRKEFIDKIAKGAVEGFRKYGVYASVTIGQAILESGWGKSKLATQANNLYGIKADSRWTGEYVTMNTKEDYGGSSKVTISAKFRKYKSWDESTEDHAKFLKENQRYTKHGVFSATNYYDQLKAIKAAGYANDRNYVNLVDGVIKSNKLTEFDK